MPGTQQSDSTLLITVGRLHRPALAMWGGRQRGLARSLCRAFSMPDASPHM